MERHAPPSFKWLVSEWPLKKSEIIWRCRSVGGKIEKINISYDMQKIEKRNKKSVEPFFKLKLINFQSDLGSKIKRREPEGWEQRLSFKCPSFNQSIAA